MVCACDPTSLHEDINIMNNMTETVLDACKEVGVEVNADKTRHMFLSSEYSKNFLYEGT